jgi:tRNA-splicing ligase RtcB
MEKLQLNGKDLRTIGYPEDRVISIAMDVMQKNYKHHDKEDRLKILQGILSDPLEYMEDMVLSKIATALLDYQRKLVKQKKYNEVSPELLEQLKAESDVHDLRHAKIEYSVFGQEHIEAGAIKQMEIAMRLPVAVAGALMPDAHQGYGLPIGGVLAAENAVIPYAVGVDIGCRMCLSVFEMDETKLQTDPRYFGQLLFENTLFGAGRAFEKTSEHAVLDRKEFEENPLLKSLQMKAAKQLGSSGSGNHFVEFGLTEITNDHAETGLKAGRYIAVLSHSGSRGLGASIANHYTRLAMKMCKLPNEAKHLAWLSLDSQEGQEYWLAMNLAGDYASACHHAIHHKMAASLGLKPLAMIENHHNFAWKEIFEGKEVIVHRKGATPAGKGVLGIIPGSMTQPGFIVSGKGEPASLNSASHGAGRKMSRTQALNTVTKKMLKDELSKHQVTLLGAGLDEAPHAYKDIFTVMQSQKHLVDVIGTFQPRIVMMDQ